MLMLAAWLVLSGVGVMLAAIDVLVRRLPTPLIARTAVVVLTLLSTAACVTDDPRLVLDALIAGAAVASGYGLLSLTSRGGIGMGDVRLAGLLGLGLGTIGWPAVLLGAMLPYVLAVPQALLHLSERHSRGPGRLAFGPYLVGGALLTRFLLAP
ncbi:prepilin peptidase [Plantactinospora sp. CA-290183]|uniref:prepilin peptidase n=1 Tax=Plantactinospora sp. CA-290183 TaxID=3240006 RepID=UPI003D928CD0